MSNPVTPSHRITAELFAQLKEQTTKLRESGVVVSDLLKLIDAGEDHLSKGEWPDAESAYDQARTKLATIEVSHRATPLAHRLFGVELGYLGLLLLLAYGVYQKPDFALWKGVINLHTQTAWFGALGGVAIAIYGLYQHIQKRDFDPQYDLWYISKPIIGAIFGWFISLIYYLGLVTAQTAKGGLGSTSTDARDPSVFFVIAFLAGFSERFTIKLVDKLMSVLTSFEEKPDASGTPPAGKTP